MLDKLLRYGEVERLLGKNPNGSILDVGAGPLGLGACLPYRFVGVDTWYPEPPISSQMAVKASATCLPFADKSFDFVLCIEVLEHIPFASRPQVVAELTRVARKRIIITHPFGKLGRLGDRLHWFQYGLLRPLKIERPWWLQEHFQNPLPDPKQYLGSSHESFQIERRGQENWFLHNPFVFLGNLKRMQRKTSALHEANPERMKKWVGRMNFPPYYRLMLVLDRIS